MPKENAEKTKSARSRSMLMLVAATATVAVLVATGTMFRSPSGPTAEFAGKNFALELADTPDEQVQGLSDRSSLAQDTGMLFVFYQSAIQCFWMKDMHMNIDMVWLDEKGKVLHIESDVSPKTYPKQFCPDEPSKYVLETNADVMKSLGVKPGEQITLDL